MTSVHDRLHEQQEEAEEQTQGPVEQAASRQGAGTRVGARTREVLIVALRVVRGRLHTALDWLREMLLPRARTAVAAWWKRPKTSREAAAPDPRRSSLWSQAPAPVADLVAYTRSGAWAPGERAAVIELVGKAYGFGVAIPATVLLYAAAWTLQRPTRVVALVGFLLLLRLSWGA